MSDSSNPLLGAWISDSTDPVWKRFVRVTFEFFPEGMMRQKWENKWSKSELKRKYTIEKNVIVFSAPPLHDARSKFKITDDGKFILYEGRKRYTFVRKT